MHLHSQYSVLQATPKINHLVQKAVDENMPAVTLTDHSNMFGAFKFMDAVLNQLSFELSQKKKEKLWLKEY